MWPRAIDYTHRDGTYQLWQEQHLSDNAQQTTHKGVHLPIMTGNSIHVTTHNRQHTPRWHLTTVKGAAFVWPRTTDDTQGSARTNHDREQHLRDHAQETTHTEMALNNCDRSSIWVTTHNRRHTQECTYQSWQRTAFEWPRTTDDTHQDGSFIIVTGAAFEWLRTIEYTHRDGTYQLWQETAFGWPRTTDDTHAGVHLPIMTGNSIWVTTLEG